MRKTGLIFLNSLQRMRLVLAISIAVGILLCVFTALFASIAPGVNAGISLGYIDNDNSVVSKDFERYATEHLGIKLVKGDIDYLNNELVEKHISAIVEVPSGFGNAVLKGSKSALLATYMDDYANKVFLQAYFESYTNSVDILAASAQGDANKLEVLLEAAQTEAAPVYTTSLDESQEQRYASWTAFIVGSGFFLFIAALLVLVLATIIYEDRVNHTFQRVQATNVNSFSYVVGVCAAGFVSIVAMAAVFLAYCALSDLGEMVPLGPVAVLCVLFVLLCVAFALVCGLFFQSRSAILWSTIAISTLFSMLGGAWFSISYAPELLQQLAHLTPQFWFIDALYQMQDGVMDAWIGSAGILALFSLLCFLIAGVQFASKSRSA